MAGHLKSTDDSLWKDKQFLKTTKIKGVVFQSGEGQRTDKEQKNRHLN